MSTVRLGDGSQAELAVAGTSAVVLDPSTLGAVEFAVARVGVTVVDSPAGGIVYTVADITPAGGAGGTGGYGEVVAGSIRYRQRTPAATWSFVHPLGRAPQVTVYIAESDAPDAMLEQVDTSVTSTSTQVIVEWPFPVAGELIVQ